MVVEFFHNRIVWVIFPSMMGLVKNQERDIGTQVDISMA